MNPSPWSLFQQHYLFLPSLGIALDTSTVGFPQGYWQTMAQPMKQAFEAMQALEAGALANPDEGRQVGHYWLRNPQIAPTPALQQAITENLQALRRFVEQVHTGQIRGAKGPFTQLLVIGIGGSALGPQFVAHALGKDAADRMVPHFLDNTDPDGMDRVFRRLQPHWGQTLVLVVSKSGSTPETRNGMLETKWAFEAAGLSFAQHAVAITGAGSQLDHFAQSQGWLGRFPMWDWVGGRTSQMSNVGLLPAALQGVDIDGLLAGAAQMDASTRVWEVAANPAARLALAWYYLTEGKGTKAMVVLPYKDRLELFSRYLQQLVMESLGKAQDLQGLSVHQGLTVYGNKGSTDQHAYVQQLRDGLANFFATFIVVDQDRENPSKAVENGFTCGDFLRGFFLGTRQALWEGGRPSVAIRLPEVSAASVGALIALFERAVGFYASLIHINAYHQPGVEAGKKAAAQILELQGKTLRYLQENPSSKGLALETIARGLGLQEAQWPSLFWILEGLCNNRSVEKGESLTPESAYYRVPASQA